MGHMMVSPQVERWIDVEATDPVDAKRRVSEGEPLAYVLGNQPFLTGRYQVTPAVLIPRPETELFVQNAIQRLKELGQVSLGVEIGIGSGVIALELLKAIDGLQMDATEWSQDAIDVARHNAEAMGLGQRLNCLKTAGQDQVFEPLDGLGPYDFLISNPPYLDRNGAEVMPDVLKHEPSHALFAPLGKDSSYFYTEIAQHAGRFLREGGIVIVELPHERAEQIKAVFESKHWSVQMGDDLTGRPRWLVAKLCRR